MFGNTDVDYRKERSPEAWQVPPVTPCISNLNMYNTNRNYIRYHLPTGEREI
jgi:hypothetical protein